MKKLVTCKDDPCPCGSGRKLQNCCINEIQTKISKAETSPIEPFLQIISSFEVKRIKYRVISNRLYIAPATETFHEFLFKHVQSTFGETWWKQQLKSKNRHQVINWAYIFSQMTKKYSNDQNRIDNYTYEADAPSSVWALLSLGYDLLILQSDNNLPDFMVNKLRKHKEFQSSRYEIAVASIMARSGFRISFLDKLEIKEKHCEFIAIHNEFNLRIGVEAKSRRRKGSYHEKGEFDYTEDYKGILDLVRSAKKQRPDGFPFFIFVDLNLPHSPGVPFNRKHWISDVKKLLEEQGTPSKENPHPYTAIVVTNYSHHYGDLDSIAFMGEYRIFPSLYPEFPISQLKIFDILNDTLSRYDKIPKDL